MCFCGYNFIHCQKYTHFKIKNHIKCYNNIINNKNDVNQTTKIHNFHIFLFIKSRWLISTMYDRTFQLYETYVPNNMGDNICCILRMVVLDCGYGSPQTIFVCTNYTHIQCGIVWSAFAFQLTFLLGLLSSFFLEKRPSNFNMLTFNQNFRSFQSIFPYMPA